DYYCSTYAGSNTYIF
nr:immunoglobulin light chain junction region [Macaca mulatta]MOW72142.1 immunoglobulin light chain junction region [Macaca mulatta]